jgi:hypothetical protein
MAIPSYYNAPEFNPTGDFANGQTGSLTDGSLRNAGVQGTIAKPSGNPFADMLTYSMGGQQPGTPFVPRSPQTGGYDSSGINPAAGTPVPAPQQPYAGNVTPPETATATRFGGYTPPETGTGDRFGGITPPEDPSMNSGGRTRAVTPGTGVPVTVAPPAAPVNPPEAQPFPTPPPAAQTPGIDPADGGRTEGRVPSRFRVVRSPGLVNPQGPTQNTGGESNPGGGPNGGGGTTGTYTATSKTASGDVPPPVRGPNTPLPPDPTMTSFEDILTKTLSQVQQRFDPMFQQQQDDLQRRLTHNASLTGALDSGGFGETMATGLNQLAGQQSAQVAPIIADLQKTAQQQSLDKYQSELAAAVQKEQIRTNADLERFAQDLQRYGIDKDTLLKEYTAQLALKGQMYSADKGVDAAALQAAASSAAASAGAEAARYGAQLGFQSNVLDADIRREQNLMNYGLGIASLGPEWARLIFGSAPENLLTGNGNTTGDTVIRP